MKRISNVMLVIFIFLIFAIIIYLSCTNLVEETWRDYRLAPYNYIYSGRDPLYFYRYDRFRKPYEDGYKFFQSYPIPHMSSHQ